MDSFGLGGIIIFTPREGDTSLWGLLYFRRSATAVEKKKFHLKLWKWGVKKRDGASVFAVLELWIEYGTQVHTQHPMHGDRDRGRGEGGSTLHGMTNLFPITLTVEIVPFFSGFQEQLCSNSFTIWGYFFEKIIENEFIFVCLEDKIMPPVISNDKLPEMYLPTVLKNILEMLCSA